MKQLYLSLTLLASALILAACGPRESEPWSSVLKQYAGDDAVHELLLVQSAEGSNATVRSYAKAGVRKWKLVSETDAFIGKNGLGKTREGDAKTPEGDFGVQTAFGILPDPGTALPWLPITESIFACDEEGPWYNRIIDTAATHHPCRGNTTTAWRWTSTPNAATPTVQLSFSIARERKPGPAAASRSMRRSCAASSRRATPASASSSTEAAQPAMPLWTLCNQFRAHPKNKTTVPSRQHSPEGVKNAAALKGQSLSRRISA